MTEDRVQTNLNTETQEKTKTETYRRWSEKTKTKHRLTGGHRQVMKQLTDMTQKSLRQNTDWLEGTQTWRQRQEGQHTDSCHRQGGETQTDLNTAGLQQPMPLTTVSLISEFSHFICGTSSRNRLLAVMLNRASVLSLWAFSGDDL